MVEMFGAMVIVAIVHPVWAIEEKAISFRIWVWFSPPSPPHTTDRTADIITRGWLVWL